MFRLARIPSLLILVFLLLISSLLFHGCSSTTDPAVNPADRGLVQAEGDVDPATGSFTLKTLDPEPGGSNVSVRLVGSNLVVDPADNTVSIDVAIQNIHSEILYSPAVIWLRDFFPANVSVSNPDIISLLDDSLLKAALTDTTQILIGEYAFDYSGMFGGDGQLDTGEISEAKTWIFVVPDQTAFSFAARAEFGMVPDLPRIAGNIFNDENRNGVRDDGEQPAPIGSVAIRIPNGDVVGVFPDIRGNYSVPIEDIGLYEVTFYPMVTSIAPIGYSTPNPLEVLILPGSDGQPLSFLNANFGVFTDVPPRPWEIRFSTEPVDSLHFAPWILLDHQVLNDRKLKLRVGFSGCGPRHPFSLYMSGSFMESNPVQVNIVPVHEVDEACDAWFEEWIFFNLEPLHRRFLQAYGPGSLILNLHDFQGQVTRVEIQVGHPDGEDNN